MKSKISGSIFISIFILIFILFGCSLTKLFDKKESFNNFKKDFFAEDRKISGEKDYRKFIKFLERYTEDNPNNQEGHYYLGYVYDRLGMPYGDNLLEADIIWETKAVNEFQKVIAINPDFKGEYYILSPYSKITGIWTILALQHISKMNREKALESFNLGKKMGGFSDAVLDNARNIFACLDKNAIIFTNGDMDTFPLWYLQYVEQYRQDVTVVNLSLLNTPWYLQQLKDKYFFGSNNIKMEMSHEDIDRLEPRVWKTITAFLEVPKNVIKKFDINEKDMKKPGYIDWTFPSTIKNGDATGIRVQDIMLLQILESNKWERPVYFNTGISEDDMIGLTEYLSICGIVHHLTPQKHNKEIFQFDYANTYKAFLGKYSADENKYPNGFKWDGIYSISNSYDRDVMNYPDLYRHFFLSFIYNLYADKDPLYKIVLRKMEEELPCDKLIPAYSTFGVMKYYYKEMNLNWEHQSNMNKIQIAIQQNLYRNDFSYRNHDKYLTLLEIYKDTKEYDKALQVIDLIIAGYDKDSIFVAHRTFFQDKKRWEN